MVNYKFLIGIIAMSLVVLSSCTPQEVTCNPPYIKVGTSCCLDQNNNSICNKDETTSKDTTNNESTSKVSSILKSDRSLDDNTIKSAIEFGKNNKFDPSAASYKLTDSNYEPLTIYTPYASLAFSVATKAKEYEELTQKEIDEIVNADHLNILVTVKGYESYEVEQAKAVIKYDDKIIKSEASPTYPRVDCSGSICEWWGIGAFTFSDFSSIKGNQVKFVLILNKEERVYDLDLSKYK